MQQFYVLNILLNFLSQTIQIKLPEKNQAEIRLRMQKNLGFSKAPTRSEVDSGGHVGTD